MYCGMISHIATVLHGCRKQKAEKLGRGNLRKDDPEELYSLAGQGAIEVQSLEYL